MSPISTYLCLAGAIVTEVVATIALAASESFSKPLATVISILCFASAFWLLSFPLRTMPTGIVYALWSGLSIVLVTAVAWGWSKQSLDLPALVGMALITAGVVVINVFSHSALVEADASNAATVPSEMPIANWVAAAPTPYVTHEGKFDWGWFRAYSDNSIELETRGERRRYRNFDELARARRRSPTPPR